MILCIRGNTESFNKIQPSSQVKTLSKVARKQRSCIYSSGGLTSGSEDTNPLDYELWDVLEQNVCWKLHPNLESLKWSIIEEMAKISLGYVYVAAAVRESSGDKSIAKITFTVLNRSVHIFDFIPLEGSYTNATCNMRYCKKILLCNTAHKKQ